MWVRMNVKDRCSRSLVLKAVVQQEMCNQSTEANLECVLQEKKV
jgi:hypothetical protein